MFGGLSRSGLVVRRRLCSESGPRLTLVLSLSVLERSSAQQQLDLAAHDHRLVMFGPRSKANMPVTLVKHVYGNTCVPVYSPNSGFLIYAIEASGGDVANSILVSDVPADLLMAKAAGVPSLALLGNCDEETIQKCHPDLSISTLDEIADAIVKLKDSSTY